MTVLDFLEVVKGRTLARLCLLAMSITIASHARAADGEALARDYLVQKVCVDASGHVEPVDPYNCSPPGTLRALEPGEPLPYHRSDVPVPSEPEALQRHDSYPLQASNGSEVVVNPFDYAPFGQFNEPRDGYDITMLRDGWASIGGTRSRLGGTTFFGAGCKPYNGWVLFPVSALTGDSFKSGEAQMPIKGVHWEKSGEAWPGTCPTTYQSKTLTSWDFLPAFEFGGVGGAPSKSIDAIRSTHGFVDDDKWRTHGHLEVFYFTRLYGLTRWESWAPHERAESDPALNERAESTSTRCSGPIQNEYKGQAFDRIACRDWSFITIPPQPEAPPDWPVPPEK